MKIADITKENNTLHLSGELDYFNVMSVYEKGLRLFPSKATIVIDFSKLTDANSAGIALMIAWLKYTKQQAGTISFQNVSKELTSIAKASGLNELLGLSS